ncbi:MAG: GAF domain-containing protein, partial [Chloroflexota bacterium]
MVKLKDETASDLPNAIESQIDILEQITGTLDLEEVLKRIVEAAVQLTEADEGSLLLLDNDSGELYMRAAKGFGEEYVKTFRQKVNDDSIAGQVMLTGESILIGPEMADSPIKVKTGYIAKSLINVPIIQGDNTTGVLAVYNKGGRHPFTPDHLRYLNPLAKYAATAIKNAHRY